MKWRWTEERIALLKELCQRRTAMMLDEIIKMLVSLECMYSLTLLQKIQQKGSSA